MDTLESYITGEYHFDKRDIREIETLLKEIIPTYIDNFEKNMAWPYGISSNTEPPTRVSISTTAMVLEALLRYCGYFSDISDEKLGNITKTNITPILVKDDAVQLSEIEDKIIEATYLLFNEIYDENNILKETISTTFGKNDIFTHAWLSEISRADWNKIQPEKFGNEAQKKWDKISDVLYKKWSEILDKCTSEFSLIDLQYLLKPEDGSRPVSHAFAPLRLIQVIRRLKGKEHAVIDKHYKYFERLLHEQLSFSSIPDSRFDPAELMFCLEGMLLCQKNVVDRSVFDRVLSVLTSVQHENAYWRPVKPFLATDRGLALFPVSVEVANSLLRASAIIDGEQVHDTYGSKCIGQLRRYWQWLRARSVRIPNRLGGQNPDWVGWHSEHVNETSVIHPWETSQVMGFLLEYRKALQSHIARTTLVRSRFQFKPFKHVDWSNLEIKFEPVTSLGEKLCTYKEIGENYVNSHLKSGNDKNYSMLLYGPPGTGKTTVAESIAKALHRNLITITVSDFLAGGEAQMEARAKSIFEVLISQPPCVVLFDEIDNFLLDRDTERYMAQDSVFQFMTPGMLTKLNDLRRTERALFIIATNYEDRIDPAIKRTGRIDNKYLLLPPDKKKRLEIIKSLTTIKDKEGEIISHIFNRALTKKELSELADLSLFLGFNDIEAAIKQLKDDEKEDTAILSGRLKERARTTSIEVYKSRFNAVGNNGNNILNDPSKTPLNEFICLAALALETKDLFSDSEKATVYEATKIITKSAKPVNVTAQQLNEYAKLLDMMHTAKIAKAMTVICEEQLNKGDNVEIDKATATCFCRDIAKSIKKYFA